MSSGVREYLLWAGLGVALFAALAFFDGDSALREPQNLWVIPVAGAAAGVLATLRRRLMTRARRRGIERSGRDPDEVEAEGDRAWRSFRRRHPVLSVLAVVAFLLVFAGLVWLRVNT